MHLSSNSSILFSNIFVFLFAGQQLLKQHQLTQKQLRLLYKKYLITIEQKSY